MLKKQKMIFILTEATNDYNKFWTCGQGNPKCSSSCAFMSVKIKGGGSHPRDFYVTWQGEDSSIRDTRFPNGISLRAAHRAVSTLEGCTSPIVEACSQAECKYVNKDQT